MGSRFAGRFSVVATLAALVPVLAAPEAASASRFFQFNMCGSRTTGDCNGGATEPVATAVKNSIIDFRPHAVSLNEACRAQVHRIRTLLAGSPWEMDGVFRQTSTSNNCPNDEFGNAVLTRNAITDVDMLSLPHPSSTETRKLVCAATTIASRTTRACSVHIRPDNTAFQDDQIREVRDRVHTYLNNGRPVVLMGDFNVEPTEANGFRLLDYIYHDTIFGGGAIGRFEEVDQGSPRCRCGEPTLGSRKLDYVFLNAGSWSNLDGDATFSNVSDHKPLRGRADP